VHDWLISHPWVARAWTIFFTVNAYSCAEHTYGSNNIQKCNCLFPDNATACKAENGKLENLSYVTKIGQMTRSWKALNRHEWWFLLNAPVATYWPNNTSLQIKTFFFCGKNRHTWVLPISLCWIQKSILFCRITPG
jgi:hypothetical protein